MAQVFRTLVVYLEFAWPFFLLFVEHLWLRLQLFVIYVTWCAVELIDWSVYYVQAVARELRGNWFFAAVA